MPITTRKGQHKGDPDRFCQEFTVKIDPDGVEWAEAEEVALYGRIFTDPAKRARLRDMCERIEEEDRAALDPAFA